MSDEKISVKKKFVFDKDYNPVYANGVWGSYTFKGDFTLNFFQDRSPLPLSIVEFFDGKNLEESVEDRFYGSDPPDMIRYVTTGVTIHYHSLKEIHNWIGGQIKNFEEAVGIADADAISGAESGNAPADG